VDACRQAQAEPGCRSDQYGERQGGEDQGGQHPGHAKFADHPVKGGVEENRKNDTPENNAQKRLEQDHGPISQQSQARDLDDEVDDRRIQRLRAFSLAEIVHHCPSTPRRVHMTHDR
jgi:hypothetical protein